MKTTIQISNGEKLPSSSFKQILADMIKVTNGGNISIANKDWNIYANGKAVNDVSYSYRPVGA